MSKIKLANILELNSHMKILIDEEVELDENGNFLIHTGYARVSTEKQVEEGYGLDVQEAEILKHGKDRNYKNLVLFIDDGYTGTNLNRPGLKTLMSMITDFSHGNSNIRVSSMVIHRIDRLGRTLLNTLQFIQDYILVKDKDNKSPINRNKEAINFYSIKENFCQVDRNNPAATLMLTLFAGFAEYDRAMIVEKMRKGKEARIASGKWMGGGNIPYGYRYDKEQGVLVIEPDEAEKVREIFRLYIEEKMSPQKISDRLGFKGEKIVTQILRRKSLTGCIEVCTDKEKKIYKEYAGKHEAIIPLERWLEAQDEIKKRSVIRGDSHYLLSGLLVCGECGAKMRYQKWNPKTGECKLVCYSQQKSKSYLVKDENCDNAKYWQSDVENAVLAELFSLSYLGNEEIVKSEQLFDPIESLSKELLQEKRKLSKLYDLYSSSEDDGIDDNDEVLKEKIANSKLRIAALRDALENEEEQIEIKRKIKKAKDIFRTLKDTWNDMTQKEKQDVCRELIDSVVIHKDGVVDVHLRLRNYLVKNEE